MSHFNDDEDALVMLETFNPIIKKSIVEYVDNHKKMGGFLTSLFSNDLFNTFGRADSENKKKISDYIYFLYWHCPSECFGSIEKVIKWIENKEE